MAWKEITILITPIIVVIVLAFLAIQTEAYFISPNVTFCPPDVNITYFIGDYVSNETLLYSDRIYLDGFWLVMDSDSSDNVNVSIDVVSNSYHRFDLSNSSPATMSINSSGWVTGLRLSVYANGTDVGSITANSTGWINYLFQDFRAGTTNLTISTMPSIPEIVGGAPVTPAGGRGIGSYTVYPTTLVTDARFQTRNITVESTGSAQLEFTVNVGGNISDIILLDRRNFTLYSYQSLELMMTLNPFNMPYHGFIELIPEDERVNSTIVFLDIRPEREIDLPSYTLPVEGFVVMMGTGRTLSAFGLWLGSLLQPLFVLEARGVMIWIPKIILIVIVVAILLIYNFTRKPRQRVIPMKCIALAGILSLVVVGLFLPNPFAEQFVPEGRGIPIESATQERTYLLPFEGFASMLGTGNYWEAFGTWGESLISPFVVLSPSPGRAIPIPKVILPIIIVSCLIAYNLTRGARQRLIPKKIIVLVTILSLAVFGLFLPTI